MQLNLKSFKDQINEIAERQAMRQNKKSKKLINPMFILLALNLVSYPLVDIITNNYLGFMMITSNLREGAGEQGKDRANLISETERKNGDIFFRVTADNNKFFIDDREASLNDITKSLARLNPEKTIIVIKGVDGRGIKTIVREATYHQMRFILSD